MKISFKLFNDFCTCANKLLKDEQVQISLRQGVFRLQSRGMCHTVLAEAKYEGPSVESFVVFINLAKLIAVCKRLDAQYLADDMDLSLTASKMQLALGGNTVTFPLMDSIEWDFPLHDAYYESASLAELLAACNGMVETVERYNGVLLDGSSSVGRLVKFNNFSVSLLSTEVLQYKQRVAVPIPFLKVAEVFPVSTAVIRQNHFGFIFDNGVSAYTTLMDDTLPDKYLDILKLENTSHMVCDAAYTQYVFDKSDLESAVEMALAVADNKKSFIAFEPIIRGSALVLDGTELVWKVGCKNSGYESQMQLKCNAKGTVGDVLSLRGIDLLSTLKYQTGQVVIYDNGKDPIIISNLEGGRISIFSRSA